MCDVAEVPQSAVVSVILGDPDVAVATATACLDAGVRVGCFRPPTVPAGTSRLRLTARAVADRRRHGAGPPGLHLGAGRRPVMSVVVITGTDTGVGKTVATAALACHARVAGRDVAVCKPVQTGTADGDDDLAEIGRLSGVTDLVGVARYPRAAGAGRRRRSRRPAAAVAAGSAGRHPRCRPRPAG